VGSRTKANLLYGGLAALGLFLYLWPALAAPVVLWSDSVSDLDWARRGVGIFEPVPADIHLAKPGYLLFLRGAMGFAPSLGDARSVVLAQSLLLWISIAATSVYIGRRRGAWVGAVLYLLLIFFLRLRDASSAVMTESVSAALLLPFAALVLFPPSQKPYGFLFAGIGAALLFWVRPNVGAIALGLATVVTKSRWRVFGFLLAGFVGVAVPVWLLTREAAGGDPLRGIAHPLFAASAEYYWLPSLGKWPEAPAEKERARETMRRAAANWKSFLSRWDSDSRRELLWRAFHGLLGADFYDARWSALYRRVDTISRLFAPFLLLGAVALLLVFPFRESDQAPNAAAPILLAGLVAQNLLLGSHPRYVLPFLPVFLLLVSVGLASFRRATRPRRLAALLLFGGLTAAAAARPGLLDWEWGQIESADVTLSQRIPRGAFPEKEPATFHARLASPVLPTGAHLEVFGPGSRLLYSSLQDSSRERPIITFALPGWLLEANRAGPVELGFVSRGAYSPIHYLLFPLVPPPWGTPARRDGSDHLSPATGIRAGSLDWWAHAGAHK